VGLCCGTLRKSFGNRFWMRDVFREYRRDSCQSMTNSKTDTCLEFYNSGVRLKSYWSRLLDLDLCSTVTTSSLWQQDARQLTSVIMIFTAPQHSRHFARVWALRKGGTDSLPCTKPRATDIPSGVALLHSHYFAF